MASRSIAMSDPMTSYMEQHGAPLARKYEQGRQAQKAYFLRKKAEEAVAHTCRLAFIVTSMREGNESLAANQQVFRDALAAAPPDAAERLRQVDVREFLARYQHRDPPACLADFLWELDPNLSEGASHPALERVLNALRSDPLVITDLVRHVAHGPVLAWVARFVGIACGFEDVSPPSSDPEAEVLDGTSGTMVTDVQPPPMGAGEVGGVPTDLPTIWSHGRGAYSLDGVNRIRVTEDEDDILTAFLEAGTPMKTGELVEMSGVETVSRVLGGLRTGYDRLFAAAIRMPGKKNTGGYFVRVRQLPTA